MKITVVSNLQAMLELSEREITTIKNIFTEVKHGLYYEPEFITRVSFSYSESQDIITCLSNVSIASSKEVILINNILNEACNGINIENFDLKIGVSKDKAKSYLKEINKVMNEMQDA